MAGKEPLRIDEKSTAEVMAEWREQNRIDTAKALKASNEMLRAAINGMVARYGQNMSNRVRMAYLKLMEGIEENYIKAETDLHFTREELDNLTYNDEIYEEHNRKFNEYLKIKGVTIEDLKRKDISKKKPTAQVKQSLSVNKGEKKHSFQKKQITNYDKERD